MERCATIEPRSGVEPPLVLDHLGAEVGHLPTLAPRQTANHLESHIGTDAAAHGDRTLGLFDDDPGLERVPELFILDLKSAHQLLKRSGGGRVSRIFPSGLHVIPL
jgi:hypothetical protein